MKLGVADRIRLLGLLPSEGDITTLKIVRTLREDLSFSEEEHLTLGLSQDGDRITWTQTSAGSKDVQIGPKGSDLIKTALTNLNETSKLRADLVDLYLHFVEGDPWES